MDPLSALSIAASVVQFVDFSADLISGTYKIYNSGSAHSTEDSELQSITESLRTLNNELRQGIALSTPG